MQWWHDNRLTWDPADYGGVERLYVKPTDIWLPDIVLYNRCDQQYLTISETVQGYVSCEKN